MNTQKTGKFIAELRKQKDLTQSQLAELIHVSDKAVSRWETGRGFPDINNLEAISDCLDVTVAELLMGEAAGESVTRDELKSISEDNLSITKAFLNRKKYVNILLGFLIGLALLITCMVHLMSPIYLKDAGSGIMVEELSDGRIIATLDESSVRFDMETVKEPKSQDTTVFLSCYTTRLDQILGRKTSDLILIGKTGDIDRVYYYPSTNNDQLLYKGAGSSDTGGVQTLPRLIYNFWLFAGLALSLLGIIIYMIFRKRYFAGTILKLAGIPIAFTLSIPICLIGKFDEVYNAPFYFTGIVLLGVVLYVIFMILLNRRAFSK